MSDIVENLRRIDVNDDQWVYECAQRAADEIERLNAEIARLREALEGIMRWNNKLALALPPEALPALAAARAALAEKEK